MNTSGTRQRGEKTEWSGRGECNHKGSVRQSKRVRIRERIGPTEGRVRVTKNQKKAMSCGLQKEEGALPQSLSRNTDLPLP